MLAISVDPPDKSREIAEAYGLEFPLLSDPELRVIDAFGVRHGEGHPAEGSDIARPATFILNRRGEVVWRDVTANWRVRVRPDRLLDRLAALP